MGDFQLYWSSRDAGDTSPRHCEQFVFSTDQKTPSLRKVRSVQDLCQLLSGHELPSLDAFAVGGCALLYGNLVAAGQWWRFAFLAASGALMAIWEMRLCGVAVSLLLAWFLLENLQIRASMHWFKVVVLIVTAALAILRALTAAIREDPRGHVLLRVADGECIIRNQCCMDVKMLIFEGSDLVRLVPHDGLLGGTLVARGASCCLGDNPPYVVKVYAPWEKELGTYLVRDGAYTLHATVPPLLLFPSDSPTLTNLCEATIRVCVCPPDCWTCSLWLPLAPLFARLRWSSQLLPPDQSLSLGGQRCVLHIFGQGPLSAIRQLATCRVDAGEGVEYVGGVQWSPPPSGVRKSASSLSSLG